MPYQSLYSQGTLWQEDGGSHGTATTPGQGKPLQGLISSPSNNDTSGLVYKSVRDTHVETSSQPTSADILMYQASRMTTTSEVTKTQPWKTTTSQQLYASWPKSNIEGVYHTAHTKIHTGFSHDSFPNSAVYPSNYNDKDGNPHISWEDHSAPETQDHVLPIPGRNSPLVEISKVESSSRHQYGLIMEDLPGTSMKLVKQSSYPTCAAHYSKKPCSGPSCASKRDLEPVVNRLEWRFCKTCRDSLISRPFVVTCQGRSTCGRLDLRAKKEDMIYDCTVGLTFLFLIFLPQAGTGDCFRRGSLCSLITITLDTNLGHMRRTASL